jgi:hypothetical protein
LVTYHAQPGSDSEERLRLLDSITTTDPGTLGTAPSVDRMSEARYLP